MRIPRSVAVISLVLPALFLSSGHVAAFCEILEPPSPLPTQVNGTQIEIQLTEGFARVVIIKEFYNPSDEFKQGQIFFPLEKGHELITDLRLKIGNIVYNSSSGDRGGALDDFLDAVSKGQDAALVQYDPPRDVYWIAVTIPPREARTTITTLEMPLSGRDGHFEYHYRLSVDARDSVAYLRAHVRVETAGPLHLHLHSHPDVPILRSGDRVAETYLNSSSVVQGRDLHVMFGSSGPSLSQFADPEGARFVRYSISAQDPAFESALAPMPRSLLVALDASGSMGLSDRWTSAKDAVRRLVADLRPGETLGLVAFGGTGVRPFSSRLREATTDLGPDVDRFLGGLAPRGSTSLTVAFPNIDRWSRAAWARGAQPIFVLITDGRPTRGSLGLDLETAYSQIAYDRSMPIFALAVRPADHPAENLLRNLSHFQRGDLFTIAGQGAEGAVAALLASIRVPVLRDLRSELPASSGVEFANPNPQALLQGGEALVLAKLLGSVNDSVAIRFGWTASGSSEFTERTFPGAEISTQSLLKRQWILMRIHGMLAALRAHEDPVLLEGLKRFATENRVVTPYTSLLVTIPTAGSGESASDREAASDIGSLLGGISGGFAASQASGAPLPFIFSTPLEAEGRRAEGMRRDLANPLVAEGELDRVVFVGTPEFAAIDQASAVSRFEGSFIRVLEVGDELVGIYREDVLGFRLYPNGLGIAVALLSVSVLFAVRRRRPGGISSSSNFFGR
jgi:hypothetical protein